jgi:hypothetical protein
LYIAKRECGQTSHLFWDEGSSITLPSPYQIISHFEKFF